MKMRSFFKGTPGVLLGVVVLAAVLGFMGCPTTDDEEDEPEVLKGILTISGEPSIGGTLTADTQLIINASGSPAYIWAKADTENGAFTAITGATASTYTVGSGDNEKYLKVTVSYTDNEGSVSSRALGPVGLPRLQGTVAITGPLEVGEDLTVDTSAVTNKSGDFSYTWLRGDGQYEAITDATEATYTLTQEDAGKSIQVIVKTGGNSGDLSQIRGPVPLPLTEDISFNTTEDNSAQVAFDVPNSTGVGTFKEAWTLNAIDQSPVYFTVEKTEDQIITVSGTHAAKVSQAAIGETRDGSTASDTLGVFGVNIGDILFEGTGTKKFTLNIAELGKAPKAVSVTLNISPILTGVAVFKVLEDPTPKVAGDEILERIPIKSFDMDNVSLPYNEPFTSSNAATLLDALAWIDRNAEAQGEYLVRVEQDEALPRIRLSCLYQQVKIRLRGYGQAREITYLDLGGGSGGLYYNCYYHNSWLYDDKDQNTVATGASTSFITVGAYTADVFGDNNLPRVSITLQLEDKITLKGEDESQADWYSGHVIYLYRPCTLIMLDGSAITGHKTTSGIAVIRVDGARNGAGQGGSGSVYMYGGAIQDNVVGANANELIYFSNNRFDGVFVKEGGSITGNKDTDGTERNMVRIANNRVTIEAGVPYSLPPIPASN
jgi:hypothetical protein